jgi:hypothetical protein
MLYIHCGVREQFTCSAALGTRPVPALHGTIVTSSYNSSNDLK